MSRPVKQLHLLSLSFIIFSSVGAHAYDLRVCDDPNNMPFSSEKEPGFENRIVDLIARTMGRSVTWIWRAQRRGYLREGINKGVCDLVAGVPSASFAISTTRPYYRSTYVFVTRSDEPAISSFDDPFLRTHKVGIELVGDDGMNTPPAHELSSRGIVSNVRGFTVYGDYSKDSPPSRMIRAVADKQIDAAVAWGPLAGYFSKLSPVPLRVTPVALKLGDFTPMTFDISMGVRKPDLALAEQVQKALDENSVEIRAILASYGVPLVAGPAVER